jgi:hypothetical protein
VKVFLQRPIEGDWPYQWIVATYAKIRQNGRIVSVAVIVAVGVNRDDPDATSSLRIIQREANLLLADNRNSAIAAARYVPPIRTRIQNFSLRRDPRNPDGFFPEFLTIETNLGKNDLLKIAKAPGLTAPLSLFTHADEVIK